MVLNFRQFWDEVESRRHGTSTAPPAEDKGGSPGIFDAPQQHEFSGVSYSGARAARGGITSGIERPERPASFRA